MYANWGAGKVPGLGGCTESEQISAAARNKLSEQVSPTQKLALRQLVTNGYLMRPNGNTVNFPNPQPRSSQPIADRAGSAASDTATGEPCVRALSSPLALILPNHHLAFLMDYVITNESDAIVSFIRSASVGKSSGCSHLKVLRSSFRSFFRQNFYSRDQNLFLTHVKLIYLGFWRGRTDVRCAASIEPIKKLGRCWLSYEKRDKSPYACASGIILNKYNDKIQRNESRDLYGKILPFDSVIGCEVFPIKNPDFIF